MNWRRRRTNSPPGTGGVAEGRGGSKVKMVLSDFNEQIRSIYHSVPARHPARKMEEAFGQIPLPTGEGGPRQRAR